MSFLIYSVEDDKDIALIINKILSKQNYEVKTFYNGKDFLQEFKQKKPDMVLLDLMLPDYSGTDLIKIIRNDLSNDDIDIIIISAKHMLVDKIEGLDLGADDYIEKPFDILELMSRVASKLRRHKKNMHIYSYKDVTLNIDSRECYVKGNLIKLTNREFDILEILLKNQGNVVKREDIFNKLWNTKEAFESRTIDMHVKAIRVKLNLEDDIIKTVYGIGYKLQ